jgi:flagellar basal body-associated protein FliL
MSTAADKPSAPPAKRGGWLILIVVAVIACAGGYALPRFLPTSAPSAAHPKEKENIKPAILPFGDVVVNLGEERLTRYLRCKIIMVIDGEQEKTITEHFNKQKAFLKSWLIGYLSDLSLTEVSRAIGVNRLRREIRDQFNAMLWPDGQELIQEVLFDEFVVQ